MKSAAVVALALLESAEAFQAPAVRGSSITVSMMARGFKAGDIGVTAPVGVYDPLGLIQTKDMRRYEIMEIKHGRAAIMGFLHVIAIEAGARFPGYLSVEQNVKFSDVPSSLFGAVDAVPTLGWLQIVMTCAACETGYAGASGSLVAQQANKAPGDIG